MSRLFVNNEIYAVKVFLVDADGRQVGEVAKGDAIRMAQEQGMDLVQIQPADKIRPPLCKIADYGKMKYEQSKHKTSKPQKEKDIFFHIGTSQHDLDIKKSHVQNLLKKGSRVRFGIELRRRERQFASNAMETLKQSVTAFAGYAKWDDIKSSDRLIFVVLYPIH